jgi:hypothetical protein
MDATPRATQAPKGNPGGHEGWIGHHGSPKMSWRMMFKLLLAMALDDWESRRAQKRNERKRSALLPRRRHGAQAGFDADFR